MEGLGALGFWIFMGLVVAASMISGGLATRDAVRTQREREMEKEREKQETLRALLEREGEITPEVLAYLRERDAAEAAAAEAARKAMGGHLTARSTAALTVSLAVGGAALFGGILSFPLTSKEGEPWPVTLGVMFGIWAAGFLIAWLIWNFGRDRKNSPPPNA